MVVEANSIAAEIPYLRSELELVQVEFEDRILDDRTVERRAMPVNNGRTAAVPPSLDAVSRIWIREPTSAAVSS